MDDCCAFKEEELNSLRGKHKDVLTTASESPSMSSESARSAVELASSPAAASTNRTGLNGLRFQPVRCVASAVWKAKAAFLKGGIMAMLGVGVLAEVLQKTISGVVPGAETMRIVGALALLVNALSFLLLYRHRADDLNMRSTVPATTSSPIWRSWRPLQG